MYRDPFLMNQYVSKFIQETKDSTQLPDIIIIFIAKSEKVFENLNTMKEVTVIHHKGSWTLASEWDASRNRVPGKGQDTSMTDDDRKVLKEAGIDYDEEDPYAIDDEDTEEYETLADKITKHEKSFGRMLTAKERFRLRTGNKL
jgi:hypothetical protein